MAEEASSADALYAAGVMLWESSLKAQLGSAEETKTRKECVRLFEEALEAGLDASTDIQCRLALGVVLLDIYREQFSALSQSDLGRLAGLNEAVSTLEEALVLDADKGTKVFINRVPQSMALLRLNAIWQQQAFNIKKQHGPERKVSYLQERLKLLDYLGGVKPPGVCIGLAFHYRDDAHNRPLTLEWLKHAAEADTYGDIDGESSFYKIAEHNKHSGKKGVAEMSTPKKTSPKPVQKQSSGGCFIATAACGDPRASEVIVLSAFRDDFLSHSEVGRGFVRLYYATSPAIASVISRSHILRVATMALIVRPAVRLLKMIRHA